jgi:hypothetical protein
MRAEAGSVSEMSVLVCTSLYVAVASEPAKLRIT